MTIDEINDTLNDEASRNAIVNACNAMPNLTSSKIYGHPMLEDGPQSLANILQQVHHVKELEISILLIGKESKIDWKVDKTVAEKQQLQVLRIELGDCTFMQSFNSANRVIEFMLQSCPSLRKFEIDGYIDEPQEDGVLEFDFSHLKQLQNIKVDIYGLSHYKLDVPGKEKRCWLDVDTPLVDSLEDDDRMYDDERNNADDYKFHIYLKWFQKNAPSIKLHNPKKNRYASQW